MLHDAARATSVTVPDDFPTIQLALDSGADSVFIRSGVYAERPAVPREVALIQGLPEHGVRPRILGLHVYEPCYFQDLTVTGCSFTGGVLVDDGCGLATVEFESCDLDSGLTNEIEDVADFHAIAIRRSRIAGPVVLRGFNSTCEADTFVAAGVRFTDEAWGLVRDCVFIGPGDRAIQHATYSNARILGNAVSGFTVGISVTASDGQAWVEGNEVRDCVRGIEVEADNWVRVLGNRVLDCGTGINANGWSGRLDLEGNWVLGATGSGMNLIYESDGSVVGNVVGRSGGNGMDIQVHRELRLENNTSFRNQGSGVRATGWPTSSTKLLRLHRNIAFENGASGAEVDALPVVSDCNDWFGNAAGTTLGFLPSATDLAVDPQFCSVDHDSVTLFASSPLMNAPGCGLVGARGVGCEAAATPSSALSSELRLAPLAPNPTRGAVRIRWSLPREAWVEVQMLDLAGRTVAVLARGTYAVGVHDVLWDGRSGTGPAPSGVYFVRLRSSGASITRSLMVRR